MLGMLAMKEVWISNPLAQFVWGGPARQRARGRRDCCARDRARGVSAWCACVCAVTTLTPRPPLPPAGEGETRLPRQAICAILTW